MKNKRSIKLFKAKEHNLKSINIEIPRDQLVVITGVSGSGKSSLAFDTIYAEGQRKYMESMSSYARQFLNIMHKPDIERIEGLPTTIAIEQRTPSHNPRSTVATTTEIYDYLRLLYARCGTPRCWHIAKGHKKPCRKTIKKQSAHNIIEALLKYPDKSRLTLLSPIIQGKKGYHKEVLKSLLKEGFIKLRVDGEIIDLSTVDLEKDNPLKIKRYQIHDIEAIVSRLSICKSHQQRIADAVETSLKTGLGHVIALISSQENQEEQVLFSEHFSCPNHPECSFQELEPRLFSFNSPFGACQLCGGLGITQDFDLDKILCPTLEISQGAFICFEKISYLYKKHYRRILNAACRKHHIDGKIPFNELPKEDQDFMIYGGKGFKGVIHFLKERYEKTETERVREKLSAMQKNHPCTKCQGKRLRKEALNVFIDSKKQKNITISDLTEMNVLETEDFFSSIKLNKEKAQIAEPILREIIARLSFLSSVGLGYLNLNRKTATLSGGESQRIRLASQVGTGLVGVCYVLDEPTIGLHQRDNTRLIKTLRHLVDIGNSVIIVEHDEEIMRSADHILDIGPGPGIHGGELIAQGTPKQIMRHKNSITGKYLTGKESIEIPKKRREYQKDKKMTLYQASENNLKNIDVSFPLSLFTCVTGVSGSGKSTLVNDILLNSLSKHLNKAKCDVGQHQSIEGLEHINRVIAVDQSPIGKTSRSNPATYTGVFDEIRALFAKTPQAIIRAYTQGRFSFNVKGGRCEECQGQGHKKVEMHFLPDVFVTCEICHGKRYNHETLEVLYREKSIADILEMTIEDALIFFEAHPKIFNILQCLQQVGLDYIQLGQASNTLSGGEAQRIKLASELSRVSRTSKRSQHNLYILDEPTTGLHFADIKKIINIFYSLTDLNNTVLVIEHNLDVIKCADWVIDLGPEGGEAGGHIIAENTPEELCKVKESYTGQYLKPLLAT